MEEDNMAWYAFDKQYTEVIQLQWGSLLLQRHVYLEKHSETPKTELNECD